MDRNPRKRQVIDILNQGVQVGENLGLDRVPTFLMAWKELRLDLPGGGECLPMADIFETMSIKIKDLEDRVAKLETKKRAPAKKKSVTKPEEIPE